jgi:hypothetical protein
MWGMSQTSYDEIVLGTWVGHIYGGTLPKKSIKIVITKSDYGSRNPICQGYSLVNNGNRTAFSGSIMVEADMPIIHAFEPRTSPKNGSFYLLFGCFEEGEIVDNECCGTWTSYDGKLKRKVKVKKI